MYLHNFILHYIIWVDQKAESLVLVAWWIWGLIWRSQLFLNTPTFTFPTDASAAAAADSGANAAAVCPGGTAAANGYVVTVHPTPSPYLHTPPTKAYRQRQTSLGLELECHSVLSAWSYKLLLLNSLVVNIGMQMGWFAFDLLSFKTYWCCDYKWSFKQGYLSLLWFSKFLCYPFFPLNEWQLTIISDGQCFINTVLWKWKLILIVLYNMLHHNLIYSKIKIVNEVNFYKTFCCLQQNNCLILLFFIFLKLGWFYVIWVVVIGKCSSHDL